MGGHASGDVASSLAISYLQEAAETDALHPDDLASRIRAADDRIRAQAEDAEQEKAMGTTVTGIAVDHEAGTEPSVTVFNIGDSRVYRLRGTVLDQLTVDHSVVQELMEAGELTAEEAAVHPDRNVVTRALGAGDPAEIDLRVEPVVPGDRFLLCSDGVSNEVSTVHLHATLALPAHPQTIANRLIELALDGGGRDNASAIVVELVEISLTDDDDTTPRDDTDDTAPRQRIRPGATASSDDDQDR